MMNLRLVYALQRSSSRFVSASVSSSSLRTLSCSSFLGNSSIISLRHSSRLPDSILNRRSSLISSSPCTLPVRLFSTRPNEGEVYNNDGTFRYETMDDVEVIDEWEEEETSDPQIGDGGDGGGVVLQGVPWGETTLSIAQEVLSQFGDDMELFSFKTSPRGYIYVRLDKMSNEYGCPSMEELERFSQEYKKRLDEAGAARKIPDDLALEVSSPGAERLLKIPDELPRFKDMPMKVCYLEDMNSNRAEDKVLMLESIDTESGKCIWKLADVRENRDPQSKGRPLSRKQKDLRINLPFAAHKSITLHLE